MFQISSAVPGQISNPKCLKSTILFNALRKLSKQLFQINYHIMSLKLPINTKRHRMVKSFYYSTVVIVISDTYEDRNSLLSTEKILEILLNSVHWFSDETLSSCPHLFYQL